MLKNHELKQVKRHLTYTLFIISNLLLCFGSCSNFKSDFRRSRAIREQSLVEIQPVADLNNIALQRIADTITAFYGFKVEINDRLQVSQKFENHEKGPRLDASMLLDYLKQHKKESSALIMGVTSKDIFITKRDKNGNIKKPENKYKIWGIFGLAHCPGSSCIVATKRIQHKNTNIFYDRLLKITLHEIGHNLGLKHCPNKKCLKTDVVESISTIDNTEMKLCDVCTETTGN